MSAKLVVFDWGGVILKHHRCWADACAAAGIDIRAGYDLPELIMRRREINARFQCGRMETADFFEAMSAATAHLYSPEEVHRIHEAWLTEEYPGVRELILRLNATPGIETALLSNTNAEHWRRHLPGPGGVIDFPTAGFLKHRFASHLLGHVKPNEQIFHAFERNTRFRGGEILLFDDLPDNIAAAKRVGWRAELIDHTGDTAAQIMDLLPRHGVILR